MGEVYEATHERLSHRYAVKFLHPGVRDHPEALPRFMREAQVTSRLRHPGIVSVVDFNTLPGGVAYLVMEYLEGEPLGKVLARTGPLPLARVVDITDQVSSALTAAHAQGVVHRDIHPQNVFVLPAESGRGERIKVLDFGISKIASISQKITGMAAVMGTPQYMSPEQAEGKTDQLDAASDQFSLAAIVYEMLTGRQAFAGETLASVAYQVVHAPVIPLHTYRPELPAELENVLARGLAKNKKDRFPSVSEFAVHLRWTATLPAREVPARPGAEPGTPLPVSADAEETTAVSALPSGMAAVLRQTTSGLSWRADLPLGSLPGPPVGQKAAESVHNEPTVVAAPLRTTLGRQVGRQVGPPAHIEPTVVGAPRRRRPVIGVAVAAGVLVIAALGLASRARGPRPGGAPAGAGPAVTTAPPPPATDPTLPTTAPAPPTTDPTPPTTDPTPPTTASALEALGDRRAPARERPHLGGPLKRTAAAPSLEVEPSPVNRGAAKCLITVGSYPWSELWVDGADTGQQTPVVNLPLTCGPHRLEFRRRDLRVDQIENVTLNEGRAFKRQYELQGAGLDD
jgi:serine/threonine-protein kinase